jgi:hypothetical protein
MFNIEDIRRFDEVDVCHLISALGETMIMLSEELHQTEKNLVELKRKYEVIEDAFMSIKTILKV